LNLDKVKLMLLFAVDEAGGFGKGEGLPWNYPEDLKHFKDLTSDPNVAIAMGSSTWNGLPVTKEGHKLPGRSKIVFSRHSRELHPNTYFTPRMTSTELKRLCGSMGFHTCYIIGGKSTIYHFEESVDGAIVTHIPGKHDADVRIPIKQMLDNFEAEHSSLIGDRGCRVATYRRLTWEEIDQRNRRLQETNHVRNTGMAIDVESTTQSPPGLWVNNIFGIAPNDPYQVVSVNSF